MTIKECIKIHKIWLREIERIKKHLLEPNQPLNEKIEALKFTITILERLEEKNLWKILAKQFGCKPNKEDCSFQRCIQWARCDNLAKAILQSLTEEGR